MLRGQTPQNLRFAAAFLLTTSCVNGFIAYQMWGERGERNRAQLRRYLEGRKGNDNSDSSPLVSAVATLSGEEVAVGVGAGARGREGGGGGGQISTVPAQHQAHERDYGTAERVLPPPPKALPSRK